MKRLKFKSIRARLLYWFLLLSVGPLIIALSVTYYKRVEVINARAFTKLTAIRDLKVQQLTSWLDERTNDLTLITEDFEARNLENIFDKQVNTANEIKNIEIARDIFTRFSNNFKAYDEIFYIDAKTGIIEISTRSEDVGLSKLHNPYFTEPMESGELFFRDIYETEKTGKFEMTLSMPVYCLSHKSHITGIVVLMINVEKSINQIMANKTGLGKTGETLIVNKELYALSELNWDANAQLNLKIDAVPAFKAASGETGIIKDWDYHGEKVLAAYTYIPQMGWGFVAKQDMTEINEPIRKMFWDFLWLFILTSTGIFIVAFFLSKTFTKPIIALNTVAKKIRAGDLSARSKISTADEIGTLAIEFNHMAYMVESKIKVQQGVVDISETMIGKSGMQEFGLALIKRLMKITGANMSTFYILNESTLQFEHFASVGANEKMLSPFSAENPQGEFGITISEKNIYYLKKIPENTIFRFQTTAGEAIPKEIISIPVIVENAVVAVISLVNIHAFIPECYDILKQIWPSINTSYSNLIASERTRIFAEHLSRMNQQLEAQSEELQDQSEELQDQTAELQRTTDELQEQNIELESQRKQVEAANKLKSEFLSNMSHELRTPLNSIMALSRVLIMQASGKLDDDEKNYLEIVERNGKHLLALINDILDLSKIEAGKMDINPKLISLGNFLQIAKENLQGLAEQKSLLLTLDIPENVPQIETDESRLHQVMTNIIGNAVKFTDQGSVAITVEFDSKNIFIKIKDTGIGISKEDLPSIFDEFRQVDGTSSRQHEGTGLGLAIASKMMKILKGKIDVESKLGEGSLFTIRIPIKWGEEIKRHNIYDFDFTLTPSDGNTILVVDDDPKTVKIISEYLIEEGFKCLTATSGKEAVMLAKKYLPFAITLDIIMEDMDGWEVMQNLKGNISTRDIPIIIVSVSTDKETGLALGAVGFITKPVNKHALISQIREVKNKPVSVMIVDDNEFELSQISKIIEKENIKTILAKSGKECINLLENTSPDVLILDLMMPEMDGFTVLEKIRKIPTTKNLPVIVVTAKDLSKDDKNRLSGNVASLLSKSEMSPQNLLSEIKRIINSLEKSRSETSSKTGNKPTILLVEDSEIAIVQIQNILKNQSYKVAVASGGQEALDFIQYTIPDGIIMDLMMPDVDGFKVLEILSSSEKTKHIPVLILTAKDLIQTEKDNLKNDNVLHIIQKGDINITDLLLKIESMLNIETNVEATGNPDLEIKEIEKAEVEITSPKSKAGISNILIVEDNPDSMTTIKAILNNSYNISEAIDGKEGLKMAQVHLPDLILLDMSLPKMNGEEIVNILKSNNETLHIPIIAVTAQAMMGDKEHFIKIGCNGYVAKPINAQILLNEISVWLNE